MPHVDDGTLHALLDGALRAEAPDRAAAVEAHLDACADCRARLEHAAALRDDASDVLAALDAPTRPDFDEVMARATASAGGTGEPRPARGHEPADGGDDSVHPSPGVRRQYRWTRGLAWAATLVVALGTGYIVRDLAGPAGEVPRSAADRSAAVPAADSTGAAPAEAAPADRTDRARPAVEPGDAGKPATDGAPAAPPPEPAAETESRALEATTFEARAAEESTASPELVTGVGVVDDFAWRPGSLEEAETRVGPILVLPGAEVTGTELAADRAAARTRQRLTDGVEVTVVQATDTAISQQAELAGAAHLAEGAPADGTEADEKQARAPVRETAAAPREHPRMLRTDPLADAARSELRAIRTAARSEGVGLLVGLDLDSAAATVTEPEAVTVTRDGVILTVTGRLPADALRALAATALPRSG